MTHNHLNQPARRIFPSNEQMEIILNGCILHERSAQRELYHRFHGYAHHIASAYSTNSENVSEMTNDAFVKTYKGLQKFNRRYDDTTSSFAAWFKQVVIYACIDHLRRYSKKEKWTKSTLVETERLTTSEGPEENLRYKEIIHCIQKLSPTYKKVFHLFAIEGFSHSEIACRLNISEGTSKSNFYKARQNLKALLAIHEA